MWSVYLGADVSFLIRYLLRPILSCACWGHTRSFACVTWLTCKYLHGLHTRRGEDRVREKGRKGEKTMEGRKRERYNSQCVNLCMCDPHIDVSLFHSRPCLVSFFLFRLFFSWSFSFHNRNPKEQTCIQKWRALALCLWDRTGESFGTFIDWTLKSLHSVNKPPSAA